MERGGGGRKKGRKRRDEGKRSRRFSRTTLRYLIVV